MKPARYARLKEIVLTALALPDLERGAYLGEACAGDAALREEAEALLRGRGHTADAVRTGALEDALARVLEVAPFSGPARLPDHIGPYRVLGLLGEGGMGSVYRARQEEPVRRDVALKVIRGCDSGPVLARFESERQALARMDDPGIARLLDAGSTTDGRPWFAMELIEGVPITTYVRAARADQETRLRLLLEVCRAVRHAHQKGIIHRDLKPSNVLVTLVHDRPVPKIIDFSIARALGESLVATEYRTRTGQVVGTVEYMSPEQARGDAQHVDTRSDVYSLGVLMYELMSDRLPYDVAGRPLHEAVKAIVDDPPRPLRSGDSTPSPSRRVDPDVETIARKCLEKDPERRYGSAAELVEDLERVLSARPILARPPSAAYQFRKLVARHRLAFGATAAVIVALAAGVVGTSIGLVRARREREEARLESATAEQVIAFLLKVFAVSDPGEARGRSVSARELLDKGAEMIRKDLAGQPRVQARLMSTLGTVYQHLGLNETARPLIEEALATQRRLLGPDHPETIASLAGLGWLDYQTNKLDDAEPLLRESVDRSLKVLPPDGEIVHERVNNLGVMLWKKGRLDEARALFARNLEVEKRIYGEENATTLRTTNNLGIIYASLSRYDEAEPLFAKTLEVRRKMYGNDNPILINAALNLALVYETTGRSAKASPLLEEILALSTRVYGEEHPETTRAMSRLASNYAWTDRLPEAENLILKTLALQKRTIGVSHQFYLESLNVRSDIYDSEGRAAAADESWQETFDAFRRAVGPRSLDTCYSEQRLAMSHAAVRRYDEARTAIQDALACTREVAGPREPTTLEVELARALIEIEAGDREAGRAAVREAIELGWHDRKVIERPTWAALRDDEGVRTLLAGMETTAKPSTH